MTTSAPPVESVAHDAPLLNRVLAPYRENCRYLKSAEISVSGESMSGGVATARCEFEIDESCYIDDTGHFNAVEFNICYNQMFYYIIAKGVQDRLFTPFDGWTMQDYWDRQLPDILIAKLSSSFRRPINARKFSGEIRLEKVVERVRGGGGGLVVADTTCQFWDDNGGDSRGDVKIAITNAPVTEAVN
ncbi:MULTISPECIES: FcoT family thioesterase [unclassified Streptomyces]|uniref:FcoT family thioesterase n=1 Tax=unclassified Streptomyces TaxID=2593676 RepID=UPI0036E73707